MEAMKGIEDDSNWLHRLSIGKSKPGYLLISVSMWSCRYSA